MTTEQKKKFLVGGIAPQEHSSTIPPVACNVPRPDVDMSAHIELNKPLEPASFNGMSIDDVRSFSSLRGCDMLHAQDKVASIHERSTNIRSAFEKVGKDAFINSYNKKHN